MIEVRSEREHDRTAIRRVHELGFGQSDEADLVDALRESDAYLPELSVVAGAEGRVVGHVLLSRARLDSGAVVLALAPIAVVPERQREGIGGALVEEALARASRTDFPLVVVLGHPEYYPRFGFEPAAEHGITAPFPVPAEAWMAFRLPRYEPGIRGGVIYPAPFTRL